MKTIKPVGKRVLIKRSEAAKTQGGILLPDSATEAPKEGIVVAVGTGALNEHGEFETPNLKEGDRVLFSSYAGTTVKNSDTNEEEFLIMSESDVFGVFAQ